MDMSLSPEHLAFRDEVRSWIQSAMPAHIRDKAAVDGNFSQAEVTEWHKILAEKGWIAPHWPKEYGGAGLSTWEQFIFNAEMAEGGAPSVGGMGVSVGSGNTSFGSVPGGTMMTPGVPALGGVTMMISLMTSGVGVKVGANSRVGAPVGVGRSR